MMRRSSAGRSGFGEQIDIFPVQNEDRAWRVSLFGDEIDQIVEFDPLTGNKTADLAEISVYANSHYVTPRPTLNQAMIGIKNELRQRLAQFTEEGSCWRRSVCRSGPRSTWK